MSSEDAALIRAVAISEMLLEVLEEDGSARVIAGEDGLEHVRELREKLEARLNAFSEDQ